MSDLVERLRSGVSDGWSYDALCVHGDLALQAADHIETLEAQNESYLRDSREIVSTTQSTLDELRGALATAHQVFAAEIEALHAQIQSQAAEIARLKGEVEWRDIESAPRGPCRISPQSQWFDGREHGPVILVSFRGHKGFEEWDSHVGWWEPATSSWRFLEDDGIDDVQPTHWRPLPSPPVIP